MENPATGGGRPSLDWGLVARHVAEYVDKPVLLLDRSGDVLMSNAAMDTALGWNQSEVAGRSWLELCIPQDLQLRARKWLTSAQRGLVDRGECEVVTTDGRRLRMVFVVSVIGHGRGRCLLMLATSSSPVHAQDLRPGQDHDYEINSSPSHFGELLRLLQVGGIVPAADQAQHCYEILHGRTSPCADCPVLLDARIPWPRTTVRKSPLRPDLLEIVTANSIDAFSARVSVRGITKAALDAIHEAKISELAARARLSPRERSVLLYLVTGRSLREIAEILQISPRTVKFHQARLLEKVGAESRNDLVRLVSLAEPIVAPVEPA